MRKNKKSLREQDPFLARELAKYGSALPSREWVLEIVKNEKSLTIKSLSKLLSIDKTETEFFMRRLIAMEREGQIKIENHTVFLAPEKKGIECRVCGHPDGFGFATPTTQKSDQDFYLDEKQMRSLMHGDTVLIEDFGVQQRGKFTRRKGRVMSIVKRGCRQCVARVIWRDNAAWALPDEYKITHQIELPQVSFKNVVENQIVLVNITRYPDDYQHAQGEIVRILGHYGDKDMEITIAVQNNNLPTVFSELCQSEAEKIGKIVPRSALADREDLRDLPLVTIDGETSRDFDDAVYAEQTAEGWKLIVAIADVAHYVQVGGAIDADAYERGTSVYFPRTVIPMLPESLSNGICSLNPRVNRLVLACEAIIDPKGQIKHYRFFNAVMKSRARLTYKRVWAALNGGQKLPLQKEIESLYALYQVLDTARKSRGAMNFDTIETQMFFNENGKIDRIERVERNDAHRLIEECMLVANVCAADFLIKNQHHALFRTHAGPEEVEQFRNTYKSRGVLLGGGNNPTPKDFSRFLEQIEDFPDKDNIQVHMLTLMRRAQYAEDNVGHFGLAYEAYTHFTSPIRRYPDLLVHRAIKAILNRTQYIPTESWDHLGVHCSYCERRADDASRDVELWLKNFYLKEKLGEIFSAQITGVGDFGLFIMLEDIWVESRLHISQLGEDYFIYHSETMSLEGKKTGEQFKIGDRIRVKVVRVDLDRRRADFDLIGDKTKGVKGACKEASARNKRRKSC